MRPSITVEYEPMTSKPDSTSGEGGVFGNLPSERPGVRSPRRQDDKPAGKSRAAKATAAKSPPRPRSAPAPSARRPAAPPPPSPRERAAATEGAESRPAAAPEAAPSHRGIEDVAWAGVTVAAEAATLGVRLLSRAVEAVRERR
jgi:hypothetical protein